MKSKPRTEAEKRWHSNIAEFARNSAWMELYLGYCQDHTQFHIHHCEGAQAKRKVNLVTTKIGEFYVMPIPCELHDISSNSRLSITTHKRDHEGIFGDSKKLWLSMVREMERDGYALPFNDEMINAIVYG